MRTKPIVPVLISIVVFAAAAAAMFCSAMPI